MDATALPEPPDEVSAGFWEGTTRGELVLQRCAACGHIQHYPRPLCTSCSSRQLESHVASGQGWIYAHSTVHRSPLPDLEPPYVVALVDLAEGPRLLTRIEGPTEGLRCGSEVGVVFEPLADGRALPCFRLVQEGVR